MTIFALRIVLFFKFLFINVLNVCTNEEQEEKNI
jgi:hypothetical protein